MAANQPLTRKEINHLVEISKKVKLKSPVNPIDIEKIATLHLGENKTSVQNFLTKIALPGSIILGMSQASFPEFYANMVSKLPSWTNMSNNLLAAVDYVWGIIGKPVKQNNIIYHIPNIILYSFGVVGVKKLFEFVRRKSWLDKVIEAKELLEKRIEKGSVIYDMRDNHSILFIGKGDFIGEQFYINSDIDNVITLASLKPTYTDHWLKYDITSSFTVLNNTLQAADGKNCGEYILFPVKDTELFLPGEREYDISPEKIEVLIHTIRDVEKNNTWEPKRIIIVGDRKQMTAVRTETKTAILENTKEDISLASIDKEIRKVTIIDASDLVIKEILKRYPDRRIFFRSSVEGSAQYKKRFYERLDELGYNDDEQEHSVIIGYDIHEEQIERESIKSKMQEYLPVVLSKDVHDALLRNGFTTNHFIYVPDLVIKSLKEIAALN